MAGATALLLALRAMEMAPWHWLFLFWVVACLVLNSLPTALFFSWICGRGNFKTKTLWPVLIFYLLPAIIAEAYFLPEEIRFRIMVAGRLDLQEEHYYEQMRGQPFGEYYLMYDEEIGFWVMD